MDRNLLRFENLEDPDMGEPLGGAGAQDDGDLCRRRRREAAVGISFGRQERNSRTLNTSRTV